MLSMRSAEGSGKTFVGEDHHMLAQEVQTSTAEQSLWLWVVVCEVGVYTFIANG